MDECFMIRDYHQATPHLQHELNFDKTFEKGYKIISSKKRIISCRLESLKLRKKKQNT